MYGLSGLINLDLRNYSKSQKINPASKKQIQSMLNLCIQNLEDQIQRLIRLSSQLQESNQHLLKKNKNLQLQNNKLLNSVSETKIKIRNLINKLKIDN